MHEVTNRQFKRFKRGHTSGAKVTARHPDLEFDKPEQPVVDIRYSDAVEYIGWLNERDYPRHYRLPTRAERALACQAHSVTRYYWGTSINEASRYENLYDPQTKLRWD